MKTLNFFNLVIVMMAAFFTWNAVAAPVSKVHVLENLSAQESKDLKASLAKLGFKTSSKALFSESKHAFIITKALPTETENASMTIELVQMENDRSLPKSVFKYTVEGTDFKEALRALPEPQALIQDASRPVALQN